MPPFSILQAAANLPKRQLRQGSVLYRAGDKCDNSIYLVVEGTLILLDGNEGFRPGREVEKGGLVGDIEVMSGAPERLQSYKAKSEQVTLAVLDKRAADLIGSMHPEFFLVLLRSAINQLDTAERELIAKDS